MGFDNKIQRSEAVWMKFEQMLAIIAGGAMIFLTFLVVVDVGFRYMFNSPISGATEGTELIMPYIVFLALGYTLATGGHVRVTILLSRLSRVSKELAEIIDSLIGLVFFGILTYFAGVHFWESFVILEFMMAPIKLPWWVGKFSMPLGFFVISVQFLLNALKAISCLRNRRGAL